MRRLRDVSRAASVHEHSTRQVGAFLRRKVRENARALQIEYDELFDHVPPIGRRLIRNLLIDVRFRFHAHRKL